MYKLTLLLLTTDEEPTVARMLDSVLPLIDSWVVSYNGKQQRTAEIIREKLGHLPGKLFEAPWVSYGHNRTEALRLASDWGAEHVLVVDADEVVESAPPLSGLGFLPKADAYEVDERMGAMVQRKLRVFRCASKWQYVGGTHEFPQCKGGSGGRLSYLPIMIANLRDGAGSRADQRERYLGEADMLRRDLDADPANGRAAFYLAQSLELAGDLDAAIEAYERRFAMPGWDEEAFYSLLRIAQVHAKRLQDAPLVPGAFYRAWQFRPSRCEPLVELAEWHRNRKEWYLAMHAAERAAAIPMTTDRLFVLQSYYQWRALDEWAIAAHYAGDSRQALEVSKLLLERAPEDTLHHVADNAAHYRAGLKRA